MRVSPVWARTLGAVALSIVAASSAHAQTLYWNAFLSGPAESPPNASPGTGYMNLSFNQVLQTLTIVGSFSGLTGITTASHIHCCTATALTGTVGVATMTPSFFGFPLGVTGGSFDQTYDMTLASSWNASYITANGGTPTTALAALLAGMNSGKSYFNVHTTTFGGGEIRGFINVVPEPGTYALMSIGLVALGIVARRRRRSTKGFQH